MTSPTEITDSGSINIDITVEVGGEDHSAENIVDDDSTHTFPSESGEDTHTNSDEITTLDAEHDVAHTDVDHSNTAAST
ncbi:hypothetical protein R0J87_22535, partial [Halomonas sp. SIMBA_159]